MMLCHLELKSSEQIKSLEQRIQDAMKENEELKSYKLQIKNGLWVVLGDPQKWHDQKHSLNESSL